MLPPILSVVVVTRGEEQPSAAIRAQHAIPRMKHTLNAVFYVQMDGNARPTEMAATKKRKSKLVSTVRVRTKEL